MRRRNCGGLWLVVGLLTAASAVRAQGPGAGLPMYEQKLAGVVLGWQARTITGMWDQFDDVTAPHRTRLKQLYSMPDHIIMRLGTKPPIVQGSGSSPYGQVIFLYNPYGPGVSVGGGGGGGGEGGPGEGGDGGASAEAMERAPTDAEVLERVRRFTAQAQGRPPSEIAGAATGAAPPDVGGEIDEQGGGLGGTGGGGGAQRGFAIPNITAIRDNLVGVDRFYWADRARIGDEIEKLTNGFFKKFNDWVALLADERRQEQAAAMQLELGQMQGMLQVLNELLGGDEVYHVYHPGHPLRDLVFCYEAQPNVWISFTINFVTWQINGITVTGYQSYPGARLSNGPDGGAGIQLGSSLEDIFNRYGWPDGFESFMGRYLLVHYFDTNNVGFVLDHPSPKVYRVVRIIIEPRPYATERQLGYMRLGENANELLTRRGPDGRLLYGEPYAVERPNHRLSIVGDTTLPWDRPPGLLLDRRLNSVLGSGGGGQGGEGGAEGGAEGGSDAAPAEAQGLRQASNGRGDRGGRIAQAQSEGDAGEMGEGGGGGGATSILSGNIQSRYPMRFFYARNSFNDEYECWLESQGGAAGDAGGGGAPAAGGPSTSDLPAALRDLADAIRTGSGGGGGGGEAPAGGDAGGGEASAGGEAGGGGGGATGSELFSRDALAAVLNEIYGDTTGQVGFNLAYGCRVSPGNCAINLCTEETETRWDYGFRSASGVDYNDVRVEFGLDLDGLTTQIGVLGPEWSPARTERGIGLGSSMRSVMLRYGPPLLYDDFVVDWGEFDPNIAIMGYAVDHTGRGYGNINFAVQDKRVTGIQIIQLRGGN